LKSHERLYIEQKDDKFVHYFIIAEGATMVSQCHLYQWTIWICVFLLSSILSCSKSSESASNSEGELFIKLLDAPANYQRLNIVIVYVSIHRIGASEPFSWSIVSTNTFGPVNLLSLRNGESAQLLLNKVPVGEYDQIKLRFGTCTVIENGSESLLNFYTAPLFEHVLDYNFEVQEGKLTQLTFDFNVTSSVSKIGYNYFLFTPVIRVQNTLLSGSISGSVVDSNHNVVLTTISTWTGIDSVSTLNDTSNGSFQLSDLPEKSYSIRIAPFDTISFYERRIDSLVVTRQTKNNLGAIVLQRR
jgi:hypothetical protein